MNKVLKILDFIAKGTTIVGKATGHPEVSAMGALVDAVIDSEHDDREILNELDTDKLIQLRNEIEDVLDKRAK